MSYGLLLFMLSSGLTLIFSMMGVLNFAHASFYMLGAYFAYPLSTLARLLAGAGARAAAAVVLGALFERWGLRRVHKFGHVPELLITFGLSYIMLELVQLIWGRTRGAAYSGAATLNSPVRSRWLQRCAASRFRSTASS